MIIDKIKILAISTIISACGYFSVDNRKCETMDTTHTDSWEAFQESSQTIDNLSRVRQFAENFTSDTTEQSRFNKTFTFPDSVVMAFKSLRSDSINQEKYLTLLYLKIYRRHLQCCHQSYELRENSAGGIDSIADPLLYEYNRITNFFDSNKSIERIGSGFAEAWVEKNKRLLSYDKIKQEYKTIKTIQHNIEKGDYWKD